MYENIQIYYYSSLFSDTLETHLYRAHGHKGHTCYLCGCQYAHLVDLNRHIKIHAEHLTPKVEKPLGVAVNGSHNEAVDQDKSTEEIEEQVVKEEYDEMDTTPQTSSPLLSKGMDTLYIHLQILFYRA